MPKTLQNVDWNLGQALYVQGVAYAVIAEKIGVTPPTVRQHSRRYAWRRLRDDALACVSRAVTKPLVERARDVRDKLGEEIERQIQVLSQCPPRGLADLRNGPAGIQGRSSLTKTIIESAEKVFAWQLEQVSQQLITVGRIENLQLNVGQSPVAPATVFPDRAQPAALSDLPSAAARA